MYADVTLKADDFKTIHNALWKIQYDHQPDVDAQVEIIRSALKDCYEQDRKTADQLYSHYRTVQQVNNLDAIWSIYTVKDLNQPHPYKGAETVTYKSDQHWGDEDVVVPIVGPWWASLYAAADTAIKQSRDTHHCFIEGFKQEGNTLVLTTGS